MHYNVKNIIKALPHPKSGWGKLAVPFVTYGGINSGIALQEGAKLLKKSGRIIVAGMKVNSSHCLSKLKQIKRTVNEGMPGDEALPLIEDLACRIKEFENKKPEDCADITHKLAYQSPKVKIKAHIIFREKVWMDSGAESMVKLACAPFLDLTGKIIWMVQRGCLLNPNGLTQVPITIMFATF